MKLDLEWIKKEYEHLRKERLIRLLPLQKVIALEEAKLNLVENFLSKIVKLENNFELTFEDKKINYDSLIHECNKSFGNLNFSDSREEDSYIILTLAFDYCMITISNESDIKYKTNVFWDN